MTSDLFEKTLAKFRETTPLSESRRHSRIEQVMPRLTVQRLGRFTSIIGLNALAKHTSRDLSYVIDYFTTTTAYLIENIEQKRVVIRGHIAPRDVRRFENEYLRQKILCHACKSPDTVLVAGQIRCKNCHQVRADLAHK